ncbi:hypothetical protein BDW02DRAFT_392189 [Decorospora gaudefroyi]|uniref:Uncharacterized protein n=1 Tax=Decorospora gaudefroyi TaxID=184978 RepID=A0A6A5KN47_9PLEO|nr:hypothetical protein BDW02DRAFT_392189 [Decorospora gaudefroyi]
MEEAERGSRAVTGYIIPRKVKSLTDMVPVPVVRASVMMNQTVRGKKPGDGPPRARTKKRDVVMPSLEIAISASGEKSWNKRRRLPERVALEPTGDAQSRPQFLLLRTIAFITSGATSDGKLCTPSERLDGSSLRDRPNVANHSRATRIAGTCIHRENSSLLHGQVPTPPRESNEEAP